MGLIWVGQIPGASSRNVAKILRVSPRWAGPSYQWVCRKPLFNGRKQIGTVIEK